jgi:hypothetical protein
MPRHRRTARPAQLRTHTRGRPARVLRRTARGPRSRSVAPAWPPRWRCRRAQPPRERGSADVRARHECQLHALRQPALADGLAQLGGPQHDPPPLHARRGPSRLSTANARDGRQAPTRQRRWPILSRARGIPGTSGTDGGQAHGTSRVDAMLLLGRPSAHRIPRSRPALPETMASSEGHTTELRINRGLYVARSTSLGIRLAASDSTSLRRLPSVGYLYFHSTRTGSSAIASRRASELRAKHAESVSAAHRRLTLPLAGLAVDPVRNAHAL